MGKKFMQAAILTFLLHVLALISSPTAIEKNQLPSWRTTQTPLVIWLNRLIRLDNTALSKELPNSR